MVEEEPLFTCKGCGSHDFIVEEAYTLRDHFMQILKCTCEDTFGDIAAQHRSCYVTHWFAWGPLDETHHWEYEEDEEQESNLEDEETEVFCE